MTPVEDNDLPASQAHAHPPFVVRAAFYLKSRAMCDGADESKCYPKNSSYS